MPNSSYETLENYEARAALVFFFFFPSVFLIFQSFTFKILIIESLFILFTNIYLKNLSIYTIIKYIMIKLYIIVSYYKNKNILKNKILYFLVQPDSANQTKS